MINKLMNIFNSKLSIFNMKNAKRSQVIFFKEYLNSSTYMYIVNL